MSGLVTSLPRTNSVFGVAEWAGTTAAALSTVLRAFKNEGRTTGPGFGRCSIIDSLHRKRIIFSDQNRESIIQPIISVVKPTIGNVLSRPWHGKGRLTSCHRTYSDLLFRYQVFDFRIYSPWEHGGDPNDRFCGDPIPTVDGGEPR
jgi:hypothetical protein